MRSMTASKRIAWAVLGSVLAAAPALAAKITIVAIGDSTTAGTPFFQSPLEKPPNGQGDPEGQYSYWMMRHHPDWTVINAGIDGQRTDEIRARFDDALKDHPRYVIILAGVNDVYQDSPLQAAGDNLAWMYHEAKALGVLPVAATVLPFNAATPQQNEGLRVLNKFIRKAADDHNMPLAEFHDAVMDPANHNRLTGSTDDLHPDVGGYRIMGAVATKVIEEMEKARPPL